MKKQYKHDYASVGYKIRIKLELFLRNVFGDYHGSWKFYRIYWHRKNVKGDIPTQGVQYLTQEPNYMSGFGHGIAIWRRGIGLAKYLGLSYAYSSMVSMDWDRKLGFGESEKRVDELKRKGYHIIKLPLFNPTNDDDVRTVLSWIDTYKGKKAIFVTAFEQPGVAQNDAMERAFIREKFFASKEREKDKLLFQPDCCNVAVHIRRGDIVAGAMAGDSDMQKRWLDEEYYVGVINELKKILGKDNAKFYVFSEGVKEDFKELCTLTNVEFCLDLSVIDSFIHLCKADVLVTGLSAFSRIAGYINPNFKIASDKLWTKYPEDGEWIIADSAGHISRDAETLLVHI